MHSIHKGVGLVVIGLVAAVMLMAPPVMKSREWDLSTTFSINHPFMVPGKTLDANTKYIMRLLDTPGSRRVVTVYNADGSQLQAMFMALPDYRTQATDETRFTFMETDRGYPKPIQTWFYPGRHNGLEFVYPKDQAFEIAQHTGGKSLPNSTAVVINEPPVSNTPVAENEPIVAPPDQVAQNNAPSDLKTDSEVIREKPTEQAKPTAEEVPSAQSESAPRQELPRTAGELPLLGLVGTLSLSLGLGIRLFSTR